MKETTESGLATALRSVRVVKGLTQTELAVRSGVDRSYISALENGRRKAPSWDIIVALARALDMSVAEFLQWTEDAPQTPGVPHDQELELLFSEIRRRPTKERAAMKRLITTWLDALTTLR